MKIPKRFQNLSPTEILLLCISAFFLLTFLWINVKGFIRLATSDVYADTLYAMEAWKSKSIFPQGWVFGNQFYVVATPVVCAVFYGITGSINLSMILSTTLMTALLILSLWWMLRPITTRAQRLAAVAVLLAGMTTCEAAASLEGQLLYLLASYYSCYLITLFLTVGDYLRALQDPKRPLWKGMTILSCLLLLATGMQSLRQTTILVLPLAVLELLRLCALLLRDRRLRKGQLWVTLRVGIYCLSNFMGLVLIRLLAIPNVSIYGETLLRTSGWAEAHEVNLRILGKITGFWYAFNNPNGWLYLIPATLFCGMTLLAIGLGVRRFFKTKRADPLFLIQLFLIIGLIGLFTANLLLEMDFRTPYMFTWYALLSISAAALIQACKTRLWKGLLAAALVIGCAVNWIVGYLPTLKALQKQPDPCLDEIAAYLTEHDYRYLYSDWYLSTMVALRTDGEVLACAYHNAVFEILAYINPQDYYGDRENAQAAYLFNQGSEPLALAFAAEHGATLTRVATFADGAYTLYTSDKQLMYHK